MYAPVLPRDLSTPPPEPGDPRAELRAVQDDRCAACGRPLATRHYFFRDRGGLRVAALVCMRCASTNALVTDPPVRTVSPLLRLRLTFGTTASFPRKDPALLRPALLAGDWDAFSSPLHALWVHQAGRCALHHPDKPHGERCSGGGLNQILYVDHDHTTGTVRSLLSSPHDFLGSRSVVRVVPDDQPGDRIRAGVHDRDFRLEAVAGPAGLVELVVRVDLPFVLPQHLHAHRARHRLAPLLLLAARLITFALLRKAPFP